MKLGGFFVVSNIHNAGTYVCMRNHDRAFTTYINPGTGFTVS